MKQKDFTKEAKQLLSDIDRFRAFGNNSISLVEYLNKDLQIAYWEGRVDSLEEQTK